MGVDLAEQQLEFFFLRLRESLLQLIFEFSESFCGEYDLQFIARFDRDNKITGEFAAEIGGDFFLARRSAACKNRNVEFRLKRPVRGLLERGIEFFNRLKRDPFIAQSFLE